MRLLSIATTVFGLAALAACTSAIRPASAQQPGAAPAGAASLTGVAKTTLPSGVIYEVMQNGSGASPKATDTVKVHYRGTLPDGREFDSSHKRGQPSSFPLNRVIPCWTEAVQLMKPGGKARLTCPPKTAYGERGAAGGLIPPNSTLKFEIELISIGS